MDVRSFYGSKKISGAEHAPRGRRDGGGDVAELGGRASEHVSLDDLVHGADDHRGGEARILFGDLALGDGIADKVAEGQKRIAGAGAHATRVFLARADEIGDRARVALDAGEDMADQSAEAGGEGSGRSRQALELRADAVEVFGEQDF